MKLVSAFESFDHFSALSAKEALLDSGIDCLFPNEYHGAVQPYLGFGGSPFQIMVSEDDYRKARGILEELGLLIPGDDNHVIPRQALHKVWTHGEIVCPNCGSGKIRKNRMPKIVIGFIISLLFYSSIDQHRYSGINKSFICKQCGHRW